MHMSGIERNDLDGNGKVHFDFLQNGTTLQLDTNGRLPKTWIVLDNQSTVNIFSNGALLTNICNSKSSMDIHCNAGVTTTNMVGDPRGNGTVWYHPNGIANILSLSCVKKNGCKVMYNSSDKNEFHLLKLDGKT